MQSIAQTDPTVSTRFAFASFGGQVNGILARQDDDTYLFFTDGDDTALDVTDCPLVYRTGQVSVAMDATYQAELDTRTVTNDGRCA